MHAITQATETPVSTSFTCKGDSVPLYYKHDSSFLKPKEVFVMTQIVGKSGPNSFLRTEVSKTEQYKKILLYYSKQLTVNEYNQNYVQSWPL